MTTVGFSGGTREFEHVTCGLVVPGVITATGTVANYSGEYCLANDTDRG